MVPPTAPHAIPEQWGLADALIAQPGLDLVPGGGEEVVLAGSFHFVATGPEAFLIEDSYSIEVRIPRMYPSRYYPRVFETMGRIPRAYHHLTDGSLCLGAPTRLRLLALRTPRVGD